MEPIGELRLTNRSWIAATLGVLALGIAMVAWEWQNARAASLKKITDPAHHGVRNNTSETAIAKKIN